MVWTAPDGTRWQFYEPDREWQGWQPGEDGTWFWQVSEFRAAYPEAPDWDGH